jgi:hypothetical protein
MGNAKFILIILGGLLFSFGVSYLMYRDESVCDELVILQDNSQIECASVTSYDSGMTRIKQCNGEIIEVPTITIKMVKQIEKN